MNCKICIRVATENGFCSLHSKAYNNILEKFSVWKRAQNASWCEYLVEIQKNSLTGEWAKDVSKYLIVEGKENVK
jgi:hypothetical protein